MFMNDFLTVPIVELSPSAPSCLFVSPIWKSLFLSSGKDSTRILPTFRSRLQPIRSMLQSVQPNLEACTNKVVRRDTQDIIVAHSRSSASTMLCHIFQRIARIARPNSLWNNPPAILSRPTIRLPNCRRWSLS